MGAEALLESNIELAREEEWVKAEWCCTIISPSPITLSSTVRFKLYLRSKLGRPPSGDVLPPLPLNKTVVQVFGDFLRYLYRCTRKYIEETHASGTELWGSLEGQSEFVLTHPNGWEGSQQAQMREAAVYAGLIPDTQQGHSRLQFVTEGEASLHYCVRNNYSSDVLCVRRFFPSDHFYPSDQPRFSRLEWRRCHDHRCRRRDN